MTNPTPGTRIVTSALSHGHRAALFVACISIAACHSASLPHLATSATNPMSASVAGIPTDLLVNVLDYRVHFIDRTTPIDACSMVRAMAQPSDYPAKIPARLRSVLNRQDADPCVALTPVAMPDSALVPGIVRVTFESFERSSDGGMVRLLVRSGENVHREDFSVRLMTPGTWWGVAEVRVWGASRVHFVRP